MRPLVALALALAATPLAHGAVSAAQGKADAPASPEAEARISLDVKDVDIADLVRVLSEVGSFQVVLDPGISCKLTLALKQVRWPTALDAALGACHLGREEENGIVRIGTLARLAEEARERRQVEEARQLAAPHTITSHRLSYAKAQELAPLLKKVLAPRGDVVYDTRTNTLFIID